MKITEKIGIVCLALELFSAGVMAGTLADSPLSLKGSVPPNVLFSLSVEFPTAVQRAYTAAYSPTKVVSGATVKNDPYLGLFDPEKCYTYDAGNGWFQPSGLATGNYVCTGQWSGNFMNWATMTGLDEFRYAMTGGNRYRDTATLTVLERTYIDDYGSTGYFPDKSYTGAGATPYPGVTVVNAKKGVQTTITGAGTDSITCTSPSTTSPYCTLAVASSAQPVTCNTWSGTGADASSPLKCSNFGTGFPAGATFSDQAPITFATSAADTVGCTNPVYNNGDFGCDLALSAGQQGGCSTWSGNGTSGNPYTCTNFAAFGSNSFSATSATAATTFTTTSSSTVTTRVPTSGTQSISCSTAQVSGTWTITCPLPNGSTATSTKSSTGGGKRTFSSTTSNWSITGPAGTMLSVSADTSGGTVACGSSSCYKKYKIAYQYDTTTSTSTTRYYIPSYSGNKGINYYYIPGYTLSFAGTQTLNVRVKVCDSSDGAGGLESNCKQFGSAWKPTGVLQDNGDKMKFGVFSYYNSPDIDNAVMRSKSKYIAPQKYSSAGGTVANANKEWLDADGTLISDPDPTERASSYPVAGADPLRSGVINYINQFGRPVDPLPAVAPKTYKGYDPAGKLYYETLKYLRGLGPTTHFYQNATATTNDDFPIITNWDDPIEYSCQKNYIIALGDKNTHCDKRLPGGTVTAANVGAGQCKDRTEADDYGSFNETIPTGGGPAVDVSTWTNKLGNLEGDATQNSRAASRTGAGSNGSWYMSGLAYWAASQDIRQDDPTKISTVGTQKVKTYVIDVEEGGPTANSQYGLAAKYGGADSFNATTGAPLNSTYSLTIAPGDVRTWPKTLLRASDPVKMIAAVKGAIADIAAQIGTESALAQSSGDLRTGSGAYIYRATFNSGGWTGDVEAYYISTAGVINSNPSWQASAKLPAHASRRIFTFNDGLDSTGGTEATTNSRKGTEFSAGSATAFAANFSGRQQYYLNRDELGGVDNNGMARINYLRGDTTNEGSNGFQWRSRTSLIGDIVNSNPLYVAAPLVGIAGNGYNAFASSIKNRTPVVYVGSNDGMLHGFDASVDSATEAVTSESGKEIFAYVPSAAYSKLSQLTSTNYSHKYFVDGSPVASEACFSNCTSGTASWKTVLVGGLNAGGQGIYALDITNPAGFSTADPHDIVLWEFTDKDDSHLGYTFSRPVIRLLNNGKWAVVFGNGFNNTNPDSSASTTGRAYLYILYVTGPTGTGATWQLGTDYHRIELKSPSEGVSPTLPLATPNGLSSPSLIDVDANGTADYIYAGDRNGNLWKIDISDSDTANWAVAFNSGGGIPNPLPLFTANDGQTTPNAQQITTGVEVTRHPSGGLMVMFGTGSYIDVTDPLGPFKTDSYYGIWDKNDGTTRVTSRSPLQKQKVIAQATVDSKVYYVMSRCSPNYTSVVATAGNVTTDDDPVSPLCPADIGYATDTPVQLGWVFDLPSSGERVVSDFPLLESGLLTFTTLTPSVDPCTGNTEGREYNMDYLTGGALLNPVFDLNGDGLINSSDLIQVTITNPDGTTTTIGLPPSGRKIEGGASDTPVRFDRARGDAAGSTSTASCSNFVPGWGCPSRMGPPTSCKKWVQDVASQEFLNGLGTGSSGLISAPMKCLSVPSGRMTWKQILQ